MAPLESTLRRRLENTVVAARGEAEAGARAALESLGVHHHEPYGHMKPEARALRNHLRARARQLGDVQNAKGELAIGHLVHECAYEHWHRMLFARFLAENNLLIDPVSKVAVSLEECEELAKEEGVHTWELAARFAQAMLPQIFRVDDPLLKVALPTERRVALETLLAELPRAVFTAEDSLGWVYQYWQREAKKAADNGVKSGAKIDADTLPAVTQLFTEHYMVLFLLHNTVGAWWAGKQMAAWSAERAKSLAAEADCRATVALPGYTFDYLRLVKDEATGAEGGWRPAAGTFPGWPKAAKDLKVLDPCCGSGHFLVATLELLVRLRMAEERLSAADAVTAVLRDNLFGLELDLRCTQIAAFNVALAAWRLASKHMSLPELHIACSGVGPNCTEEQWIKLAEAKLSASRRSASPTAPLLPAIGREPLKNGLRNLHAQFSKAPVLGSLIDPTELPGDLIAADYETMLPFLADVMAEEAKGDSESFERAVAAQGMAKAAELLAGDYSLVITNVPYLTRGKQCTTLKEWAAKHHSDAQSDLATVFVSKFIAAATSGASVAVVTPQNWLFLPSYARLRSRLLQRYEWNAVARLGPNAFQGMNFWAATTALTVISKAAPSTGQCFLLTDTSSDNDQTAKATMLRGDAPAPYELVDQRRQLSNPDARISFQAGEASVYLQEYAESPQGIKTGDDPRFRRQFWELNGPLPHWRPFQGATSNTAWVAGLDSVVDWSDNGASFSRLQGMAGWGRPGIVLKLMGAIQASLHLGYPFDSNVTIVVPKRTSDLATLWSFCTSDEYRDLLDEAEQAAKINNATAVKVAFDLERWQATAEAAFPRGLPQPHSDDPTQWVFHGHPAGLSDKDSPLQRNATVLQTAVARLAGYKWPAELDAEVNLATEARVWVEKCKDLERFADDDGVIPLVPMRGETAAEGRVRELLRTAFGADWSNTTETSLLAAAATANGETSPASNLDDWLKNRFFAEHCALFYNRPFVWHIWDGRKKDGFGVFVHYHRLAAPNGEGRRLLEKITHGYLGDWIARQRDEVKAEKAGAEGRLADAMELQKKLEAILAGEPPYDIFVRWKPLHEQPVGWEPDINDGVRANIRPFVHSGVLRIDLSKSNLMKDTDRGQELQDLRPKADFPWFWEGKEFKGDRVNGVHLTNEEKQQAREVKGVRA